MEKIQKLGLAQLYINDDRTRGFLKLFPSLAFCPQDRVISYYEHLEDYIHQKGLYRQFRNLMIYFQDNYIGRFNRISRDEPTFAISLWNQYNRVLENMPRTNNHLEGWHNGFNTLVNCSHPNIYSFLNCLKDEQSLVDFKFDNALMNNPDNTQRNFINNRYKTLAQRFREIEPIEYLKNISNLFNY